MDIERKEQMTEREYTLRQLRNWLMVVIVLGASWVCGVVWALFRIAE